MVCEDCGHYWTGPGYDSEITIGPNCPSCGSYRTQVSPQGSDMREQDMPPAAGENRTMDDMGGNPLQEGVWRSIDGGWKNRMKRDESFASTRTSDNPYQPRQRYMDEIGGRNYTDRDDYWNPAKRREREENYYRQVGFGEDQNFAPLEQGGAEPMEPWTQGDFGRGLITPEGEVHTWPEDSGLLHGHYMSRYGIPSATAEFGISPEGNVTVHKGQIAPEQAQALAQMGINHQEGYEEFGDEDWGDDEFEHAASNRLSAVVPTNLHNGIWSILDSIHKRKPGAIYDGVPYEQWREKVRNEMMTEGIPAVRSRYPSVDITHPHPTWERLYGEVTTAGSPKPLQDYFDQKRQQGQQPQASVREKMYLPWTRNTDHIAADFDVEQVIPPGPHTQEVEVEDEKNPVILQHDNPEVLEQAKEKVEASHKEAFGPLAGLLLGGARMIGSGIVSGLVRGAMSPGQGGGMGGAPPAQPANVPVEYYSNVHRELAAFDGPFDNHPSSDDKLVERASGDPEDVDSQEVNDGDHSEWQNDPTMNDMGGTDAFQPSEEVIRALEEAEPVLLHYFNSEEDGSNDPAIRKLVEALERDHPGLLDQEPSEDDLSTLRGLHTSAQNIGGPGVPGIGMAPNTQPLAAPPASGQLQQQVAPHTQGSCPHCGARLAAGQGVCPQCNGSVNVMPEGQAPSAYPTGQQPYPTQIVSAHQGPHSIEQVQAVCQFLQENGRAEEIPNVIMNPDQYGDELAQISGRPDPTSPDPDPGAPPPMPDPTQMGMPPQGMPMQAAADNIAGKCPECGSHTTGMISEDGAMQCVNCAHRWEKPVDKQVDMPATASRMAVDHEKLHPHVDAVGVPAADQEAQDDPAKDQNPGTWTTDSGEPLRVGKMYEMYSANYDIPDLVRIESIKPDEIEYTLTGEYNLAHRTSVTKQEAELMGYSFTDAEVGTDPTDNLNEQQPPDQMQAPNLQPAFSHIAGAKFTPMEQREFIDEPGVARNTDKLSLEGTHYVERDQAGLLTPDYFLFL